MGVSRTSIRASVTEGRIPYHLLQRDDVVEIVAMDADSGDYKPFRIRVEGEHDIEDVTLPIFRFYGDPFCFVASDKSQAVRIPAGALAIGGLSSRHVTGGKDANGISFGIVIGLDYSFEYVNGQKKMAYARFVQSVTVTPKPLDTDVEDFLRRAEATEGRTYVSPVRARLRRMEMILETDDGSYLLSAEDPDGTRSLRRLGGHVEALVRGRASLPTLEEGKNLCFRPSDSKNPIYTDRIKKIRPLGGR